MKHDPDGMNRQRAQWAETAVRAFRAETRSDDCDALADLLCDLMHACDARGDAPGWHFAMALAHAEKHYAAETSARGE
jgi:hypothetical protein